MYVCLVVMPYDSYDMRPPFWLDLCRRSFHAAAVAATNIINIVPMSTQLCDNAIEWLRRHGSGVTALKAQDRSGPFSRRFGPFLVIASLPCPLLLDLDLYGLSLQPGFFTACTSLTRLLLASCCMADSPHATSSSAGGNPLMQLSVLTSLQHLGLDAVRDGCSATNPEGTELELPSSLLSHLVQLTYLQVGSNLVQSDAALQHLGALTALQHLDLGLSVLKQQRSTAPVLTGLQHLQHLTALKLGFPPWPIDLHSMPALTALTALRVLCLPHSTSVDPAVLAGFRQLQQLEVSCLEGWDAEGSAALLAAIGQQPQLTRLQLRPGRVWCVPSAAAYSALTASSHLQHLELLRSDFPVGAWQHMFPPNRSLPQLTQLCLEGDRNEACRQQLTPGDVQAMVSCCPALASLDLRRQLAVPSVAPFGALTALTSLIIHASFEDNAPSLAQLTGLHRLVICAHEPGPALGSEQVTASKLLQLTVLQQLQILGVMDFAYEPSLVHPVLALMGLFIENQARKGAPPDVWLQLKRRCEVALEQAGC